MLRRNEALFLGALGALWLAGCDGGTADSSPSDPSRAREILSSVLESWKSGAPHDAPKNQNPPIRVADEEWLSGATLVDFTLAEGETGQSVGSSVHYPVKLQIRDSRGKTATRQVVYRVNTGASASVIRED